MLGLHIAAIVLVLTIVYRYSKSVFLLLQVIDQVTYEDQLQFSEVTTLKKKTPRRVSVSFIRKNNWRLLIKEALRQMLQKLIDKVLVYEVKTLTFNNFKNPMLKED